MKTFIKIMAFSGIVGVLGGCTVSSHPIMPLSHNISYGQNVYHKRPGISVNRHFGQSAFNVCYDVQKGRYFGKQYNYYRSHPHNRHYGSLDYRNSYGYAYRGRYGVNKGYSYYKRLDGNIQRYLNDTTNRGYGGYSSLKVCYSSHNRYKW